MNYLASKHPNLTQFLRKSIRKLNQHWRVNFWFSFSWYEWKNNYRMTSRMPPASIFTKGKGTDRHAIITAESPYYQFLPRSLPESFWIASRTISNMDSYRRVNAASVRNLGFFNVVCSKRGVRSITLTFTRLTLIWPRHMTWSTETVFEESWLNIAALKNSSSS